MRHRLTFAVLLALSLPAIVAEAAPRSESDKLVDNWVEKYSKMSKGDFAFEQVQFLQERCKSILEIQGSTNIRLSELSGRVSRLESKGTDTAKDELTEAVQSQRQLKLKVEELERKIEALELRQY